ncbi:MAG: hypothetical protein ACRDFB_08945, partial [Rhabdochlamydiaceae bacterium]
MEKKKIFSLLIVILLLLSVPLTVTILQKHQSTEQYASGTQPAVWQNISPPGVSTKQSDFGGQNYGFQD